MNLFRRLRHAVRSAWFWWIAGIGLVLVTGLSLSWCYWEELRSDQESLSATVRNVGVVIGGVIAILFAVWRSIVAENQAATAQRGLLNERYQKGAEMLGSSVLTVRLGGIYTLQHLAKEHPEQYHVQIMRLFCVFVRSSAKKGDATKEGDGSDDEATLTYSEEKSSTKAETTTLEQLRFNRRKYALLLGEDLHAAMAAIGGRSKACIALEKNDDFKLDLGAAKLRALRLRKADLSGADFMDADLFNACLLETDLSDTQLQGVNFSYAWLLGANLSRAKLWTANLSSTQLQHANLSGADLQNVKLCGSNLMDADLSSTCLHEADLSGAGLLYANLIDANLTSTDLSGADLKGCDGLTQEQLDRATADSDNPPKLEGVVDANTGNPIAWRGRSITGK